MPMRTVDLGTVPGSADLVLTVILVCSERLYDRQGDRDANSRLARLPKRRGPKCSPADGNDLLSPIF